MDLKFIYDILKTFATYVIITDQEETLLYTDQIYKKQGHTKLSDIIPLSAIDLLSHSKIVSDVNGKKFRASSRRIFSEDKIYYVILLDDLSDMNNPNIKLYCIETILESINDGIVMSDTKGKMVIYNNAQGKMEGLDSEDVIGKQIWEAYNYYDPKLSEHRQVFQDKQPILNKYRAHSHKDNIPRYVSYNTYPIIYDNETIGVYSISQNENQLQAALSSILDIKRKIYSNTGVKDQSNLKNGTQYTFADMIGESSLMRTLTKEAQAVSLLDTSILIVGETGTGKEVLAQSIHNYSRENAPFVGINCAAIPDNLLESILFGTTKGAYTGAMEKQGLFEEAANGTLFLDELNAMSMNLQSKLLRVLSEKKIMRVGGLTSSPIRCRIISATNEDPEKVIKDKRLREDLFYRLAGTCLFIPPLRDRQEDVRYLVQFFINNYNKMFNRRIKSCTQELWNIFETYDWPGNIRELEHFIKNMMARTKEDQAQLAIDHIPSYFKKILNCTNQTTITSQIQRTNQSLPKILRDIEEKLIIESLEHNKWNLTKTAEDLGIIRQSLYSRMKKLEILREDSK